MREQSAKPSRDHLTNGCNELLAATSPWIKGLANSSWIPSKSDKSRIEMFRLILGAIAVKQSEALQSIIDLTQRDQGHAAVSLLRAMCEEYVWVKFLISIDAKIAAEIVTGLGVLQNYETFRAQDQYKNTKNLEFPKGFIENSRTQIPTISTRLQRIFIDEGFTLKKGTAVPSFASIAKRVGEQALYRFLYHATSRVVHFSVPELMRRIWGRPGQFTVSASHFDAYWSAFGLYWGSHLYGLTFLEILIALADSDDERSEGTDIDSAVLSLGDAINSAMKKIKSRGAIPIITTEEIEWPEQW